MDATKVEDDVFPRAMVKYSYGNLVYLHHCFIFSGGTLDLICRGGPRKWGSTPATGLSSFSFFNPYGRGFFAPSELGAGYGDRLECLALSFCFRAALRLARPVRGIQSFPCFSPDFRF